jgi:hypothetical protein
MRCEDVNCMIRISFNVVLFGEVRGNGGMDGGQATGKWIAKV